MAYTRMSFEVNDYNCNQTVELRGGDDGGWVEFRIKINEDEAFGEWVPMTPEMTTEFAAALLVVAHFCEDENQELRKAAPVQQLTERLIAKITEHSE